MTDYEALNYISDYLLGKEFYIEEPVSHLQANAILVERNAAKWAAVNLLTVGELG